MSLLMGGATMTDSDSGQVVLVIGGTGFLGRRVVSALTGAGHRVRSLVREPARAAGLFDDRVEIAQGDMLDADAVAGAVRQARAVIVCVHTLSAQPARKAGHDFVDVEVAGVGNIVAACRANGVDRLLYVTSIGVAADASSSWTRGRARIESLLFASGLDVTVLRPGMIVGHGGSGFGMVERGARSRAAVLLSSRHQRFRTVAVDDLAHQLVVLLDEPRSFGRHFDVGSDDVLTIDEMMDLAAEHLGRRRPTKIHLPRRAIACIAPLVERAAKMPPGAISGFVGAGSDSDMIGDATAIRALLDQPPRTFGEAMAQALREGSAAAASS
ncbi:SDR family oxidoreductase [Streptomyces cinereospinus]|uniref:SDR family oxidoreductase n=1 Tax=Streptomyces cinereospinus TaxID=285561 RepID=A0ABV5N907_9ACTN